MSAADPVVDEYARAARHYDEKWAFYLEATTRETLRRLPMSPGARVLDIGCGTGELLRRLRAKYPGAILAGLDPVPEMLAVAKDKLNGTEDLRIGYADLLPWPSCSFDLVVSCNMFHYITHPVEALLEKYRQGDGFISYDKVTEPQRQELSRAIDALSKEVSQVQGVIAPQ